jgi:hypothetical protein
MDGKMALKRPKIDYTDWLMSFSCRTGVDDVARVPLMPTRDPKMTNAISANHSIVIEEVGESDKRSELQTLKQDTQDSLHSILEALGY